MNDRTRTLRNCLATATCIAQLLCIGGARADCKLGKIAELPVTNIDLRPTVTAKINGADAVFIVDSGAFFSMMSEASAAEFKLKTYPGPWGLVVQGVGGTAGSISATMVNEFTLAGVPIRHVEFLVGGSEVGGGTVGLLGQNVLGIADVEYDIANGVIRLMHEEGCDKANLAYWAPAPQIYSVMEVKRTTPKSPHTTGIAFVNGAEIRVMFDTGAYASLLSARAAARAGIKLDAPGVVEAGYSRGIGRGVSKTWIVPVASFKIGGEEIKNTKLRVGEGTIEGIDMLLGGDFFLSHRVYVSTKLHRLFFTYNGGPVFNLASASTSASVPADGAAGPLLSTPVTPPEPSTPVPGEPKDAAEFSRRGSAFAARRDFKRAIADLTRACELAPDQPEYFYQRGVALFEDRQAKAALSDFVQVLKLKPDHVAALVARSQLRLGMNEEAKIAQDLDAADRAAPKEADVRLTMGRLYEQLDLLPQAVTQFDFWVAAHSTDSRVPHALNERCWSRALSGQDLAKALDDCSTALKRIDKRNAEQIAHAQTGRGLARLRLGDYVKSTADFDAALAIKPKDPWALYGRGVDELRSGKAGLGEADLAAATAAWEPVAAQLEKHGISR